MLVKSADLSTASFTRTSTFVRWLFCWKLRLRGEGLVSSSTQSLYQRHICTATHTARIITSWSWASNLMLTIGPAIGPTGSSTAFLCTFSYRRVSALANRCLYYIRSAVLTFKFRHIGKRLDEWAVHQRVVHDGYIVEGVIVLCVHIVYHVFRLILKGKMITGATRPRISNRSAILVPSLSTLITELVQIHRLLSHLRSLLFDVFLFYLYRGQTVVLNMWIEHLLLHRCYAQLSILVRLALRVGIAH